MFSAGIKSVKIQAARTQILCGVDIGLFSTFGQYDKCLMENYDLFAINGEGSGSLALGNVYHSFETYMCNVFQQNTDNIIYKNGGFTGYRLLTDQAGKELYRQIVKAEQSCGGTNSADEAAGLAVYFQEMESSGLELEMLLDTLEEDEETSIHFSMDRHTTPILEILGISISENAVFNHASLPSLRQLNQGIPIFDQGYEGVEGAKHLLERYAARHFGSFSLRKNGEALSLEYIVNGEGSDQENLEKTALQLLHIIEGIHYRGDAAEEDASVYIQMYADSVRETRDLLLTGEGTEFTYREYLSAKISEIDEETLLGRIMDMIEFNLTQFKKKEIRLDHMLTAAEVSVCTEIEGNKTYHTVRKYGYD